MKKSVVLCCIVLCLLLTACQTDVYITKGASPQTVPSSLAPSPTSNPNKIYLKLQQSYPADIDAISYTIINPTGAQASVVLAPLLERRTEVGWEALSCTAGFCGVGDPIDERIDGQIPIEWYPDLGPGRYRLSFQVSKDENGTYVQHPVMAEFEIH